ncbi:class I SAM-dependent methyltransferase [Pseudonocardia oroxyli]|uniref:Methyltransferase domain-containing protein n=1 Tax=Pseudonocardia oroxyli TaxID=366584 RepID=A0A1G8EU93_PSEOR|nr:class I SAM-dependent methyltransferase [Pseudonocardia oroxyli]SDH73430.1 Methyltransferase domain-containing protein [Pseudonocardia oroxyli]
MTEVRPHFLPARVPSYDRFARLAGMGPRYWRLVAQAAIAPGATVLDIGCGTGEVALRAAEAVPSARVTGVDPDGDAIAVARRKAADRGLGARFEQAYAQHLPAGDGSVDRVVSSLMLHHLPEDAKLATLHEVRRVLAPGGSLHLLDVDGDRPEWSAALRPLRAAFGLLHRVTAPRQRGRGQGDGHGQGHGHGHTPAPAHGTAASVTALLTEAGFTDVTALGRVRSGVGGLVYYRAAR